MARNGMVSSPHALASEAGVEILQAGGSAVDAAIAASAVLSVIYHHMTSVGGDQFWLVWDASARAVTHAAPSMRSRANASVSTSVTHELALAPPTVVSIVAATGHAPGSGKTSGP